MALPLWSPTHPWIRHAHQRVRLGLDRLAPPVVATGLAETFDWTPDRPGTYCPRCGASFDASQRQPNRDDRCGTCAKQRLTWSGVTRLGAYGDPLAPWIRDMKFSRRFVWADWFGQRLGDAMANHPWDQATSDPTPEVWVVPVPMPFARRWHRGFNQAERMARALAKTRSWGFAPLLHRTRHTPPQTQVAPSRRPANVRESFGCAEVDLTGTRLVLIDDVLTSGATLRGAAAALKSQGAADITVAVAAVADPKQPGDHA